MGPPGSPKYPPTLLATQKSPPPHCGPASSLPKRPSPTDLPQTAPLNQLSQSPLPLCPQNQPPQNSCPQTPSNRPLQTLHASSSPSGADLGGEQPPQSGHGHVPTPKCAPHPPTCPPTFSRQFSSASSRIRPSHVSLNHEASLGGTRRGGRSPKIRSPPLAMPPAPPGGAPGPPGGALGVSPRWGSACVSPPNSHAVQDVGEGHPAGQVPGGGAGRGGGKGLQLEQGAKGGRSGYGHPQNSPPGPARG